jgi:ectoine hydroxylase-related dioxygenase (phytanoyl-CoA dioxygenase family)
MEGPVKKLILKAIDASGYALVKKLPVISPGSVRHDTRPDIHDRQMELAAFPDAGYAVMRNALPPTTVQLTHTKARHWFDELDLRYKKGERNVFLEAYHKQSGISLTVAEAEKTLPPVGLHNIITNLLASKIWSQCCNLFGEPLAALIDWSSVRRQPPDRIDKALGYHQDGPIVFSSAGVVFWIPLTPIDEATPGLELIPHWRSDHYLEHGTSRHSGYLETTESIKGRSVLANDLAQGDVLLFALSTPHRTHLTDSMTKDRFSIDLRAVPVSLIPTNYSGWALTSNVQLTPS